MPVRRRKLKAVRPAELAAWRGTFECEFDYFDDLAEIGVATDPYGIPDRAVAHEAWQRLGDAFLAEWDSRQRHPDDLEPWALTTFGLPGRRRRRAGT